MTKKRRKYLDALKADREREVDLIKANCQLASLNFDLMEALSSAMNCTPSDLGDWKRETRQKYPQLVPPNTYKP